MSTLSNEVKQLGELNTTLKRYMETLLKATKQPGSDQVIQQEDKRLDLARLRGELTDHVIVAYTSAVTSLSEAAIVDDLIKTTTVDQFIDDVFEKTPAARKETLRANTTFREWYDNAKQIIRGTPVSSKATKD